MSGCGVIFKSGLCVMIGVLVSGIRLGYDCICILNICNGEDGVFCFIASFRDGGKIHTIVGNRSNQLLALSFFCDAKLI